MFKIIGACTLMSASLIAGIKKRNALYTRLRLLSETQSAALAIEAKLRCMCMPLDECFDGSGSIFSEAAKKIRTGSTPKDALSEVAKNEEFLKENDKRVLYEFARGLSADDCMGQISNIRLLSQRLTGLIEDASDEALKKGKLALEGSLLAGAALTLIII